MKIIRDELSAAVRLGRKLDQEFQRYLKQKLGQQYHRNSFTVAFNNTKRIVLAGLQRESQSISYSSASVDSVKQERQDTPVTFREQKVILQDFFLVEKEEQAWSFCDLFE